MLTNAKDKSITVLVHVLVWALLSFVLFMYPPLAGATTKLPPAFWTKQCVHVLSLITVFYFNSTYLVPQLVIKEKRIFTFIGAIILISLFWGVILTRVDGWLNISKELERAFGKKPWTNLHVDFFGMMTTLLVLGISTSVTIIQHWHRDAGIRQEFESNRAIAELSFLKAQINPHFFFNTLNSIYALTYINVETSRQALHKLSRMMRYLLYETQQDTTMLSRELAFIKDYVEIMQLRLNDNTMVLFTLPDEVLEMQIAPMLLLPFVENAFKHGIDDQNNSTIIIVIKQLPDGLVLTVVNDIVKPPQPLEKDIEERGIGLVNTRRRLDLLYRDKHLLNITINPLLNKYELYLQLTLV